MRGKKAKLLRRHAKAFGSGETTYEPSAESAIWVRFPRKMDDEGHYTLEIDKEKLEKAMQEAPAPVKVKTIGADKYLRVVKGTTCKLKWDCHRALYKGIKRKYGGVA